MQKVGLQGLLLNDRYRLDAELGRGGLGVIFSAYDILLDRPVAVKVLTNPGLGTEGRNHLLHEARAVARLNHPNIVTVYDAGEAHPVPGSPIAAERVLPFIVMELVEGASLYARRPQSIEETLALLRQVCAALEHAHTHGIVHRDLKPENVLITLQDAVKLTDFGLARPVASRITTDGMLVGTLYYLPPEQAMGQAIDGRADLYSLGVILYELTAGRLPFTADDPLAVVSQHLYAPVIPPGAYNPGIPPALERLTIRLLSKQPEDRPASASAVMQALDELAGIGSAVVDLRSPPLQAEVSPLDQLARGRLVGREREFAAARKLWKQVIEGSGDEHVLLISGESGVGKTPLVREIRALAEVSGAKVLTAECYHDGAAPYAPLAQIIRSALAPSAAGPQGLSDLLSSAVLADMIRLAPDLQIHYPLPPPGPSLDPQAEQQRLFESVVMLCSVLAVRTPLLLVVEDVQWADGGSLFLLRHLARRARNSRLKILMVLTYRDVELDETHLLNHVLLDLNREHLAARLKLTRFDRQQTRQLLAVMLQEDVKPDFVDAIYRETEGNQFFIEEMCKALLEQRKLYREDGHWRWTNLDDLQLPQSVRMAIQSRVSKLPGPVQEALRLAAIFGREFEFEPLCHASELDEEALIEALEIAARAQLITEIRPKGPQRGRAGIVKFVFAHGLILAALRENVSGIRRQRLHRRVANTIEVLHLEDDYPYDALAYHYQEAGDSSRAQVYYTRAADQALSVYANQEAERYFRLALDMAGAGAERARLLAGLGEGLFRQSRYAEASQVWAEGIQLYREAGDHDQLARLYARSARAAWYAGDPPAGLALCRAGIEAIKEVAGIQDLSQLETPGIATLLQETARACRFNDLPDEALPLCQQALSMAQRLGLVEVQAETLATLGILPNQPSVDQRLALTQATGLAESAGFLATAARAHLNLGIHLYEAGEALQARDHYLRARTLAQRAGIISWEFSFLRDVVEASLELGDFAAVEEYLDAMRQLLSAIPNPVYGALSIRFAEAMLLRFRGELEEALRRMRSCEAELNAQVELRFWAGVKVVLADALIELDRLDEAGQAALEAIRIGEQDSSVNCVLPRCLLSQVYSGQGRIEAARHVLDAARELAASQKVLANDAWLCRAEARLALAERRWPEAGQAYSAAVESLAKLSARWYLARTLEECAGAHLTRSQPGDRRHALDLLRQALDIFEQLNTSYYAKRVADQLSALEPA